MLVHWINSTNTMTSAESPLSVPPSLPNSIGRYTSGAINAEVTVPNHTPPFSFASVSDYLRSLPMDSPFGCDDVERMFRNVSEDGRSLVLATAQNGGSGGYLEYIYRYVCEKYYFVDMWDRPLPYKQGRNSDMQEVDLPPTHETTTIGDVWKDVVVGQTPFKNGVITFAKAYGFRNIQTVILAHKKAKCRYAYVEIMACPSGCLNGGGQLRSLDLDESTSNRSKDSTPLAWADNTVETPAKVKERVAALDELFHDVQFRRPDDSPLVKWLYTEERLQRPGSAMAQKLFHTQYHVVPKLEDIAPLAVTW